jgi:hypothetical protein
MVDAKLNNAIESLAPVPAIPITLAIAPISAIFSGRALACLSFHRDDVTTFEADMSPYILRKPCI